jgi:glycosyltransferase involved in cell wall biosynthesis
MTRVLPISAIVPTGGRAWSFQRMLESLARQTAQPAEMIVVDCSTIWVTEQLCQHPIDGLYTEVRYITAFQRGAAVQREQAMAHTTQDFLLFLDDDIMFEPDCILRLWDALNSDSALGGVNAMIVNQRYLPPGKVSRSLYRFLGGKPEHSYAGKCIGPALCLLPEDDTTLPKVVPVEWLNLGCTLYRRAALPRTLFPSCFTGYSLMEDVFLSLTVGMTWHLANARTGRIIHDSQPGPHKANLADIARMELFNRYLIMTTILKRAKVGDYGKLAVLELFTIASTLTSLRGWCRLPAVIRGKASALYEITIGYPHNSRISK